MDLLVDAFNELDATDVEAKALCKSYQAIAPRPDWFTDGTRVALVSGMASIIDKIYTGCERALLRVVDTVDKQVIPSDDGWHRALLLRMKNPLQGTRSAVLSDVTYQTLDHLRSFRHRQRNSYSADLDEDIVLKLVDEAVALPELVRKDLERLRTEIAQHPR